MGLLSCFALDSTPQVSEVRDGLERAGFGRREEKGTFRGAAVGRRVPVSRPWTVVPLWERMEEWELLSSYLEKNPSSLPWPYTCLLQAAAGLQPLPSTVESSSTGACSVGHRYPPLQLDGGEADSQNRTLKVTHFVRLGFASCFCKEPESEYFGLCGPGHLSCNALYSGSSHRRIRMNARGCFPNKTLFMDSEISLSYNFHTSQDILFFFFSPNRLKM